ncbi:hypothetical protein [Janthinobacterium lividum]|uniref:hypothetical protein n=1 Tax=Janthinobacterium lividum TaxID=29581 RepID=UPI000874FFC2|nr:hypothetical protein [Janthinobacterium lividum]MCC7716687.1 hypothetical protein [Janthinobacterium lividum]OEZ51815.1 hypothetical protein JANLI_51440 [Janthinobacterium lividum]WQE31757.1 hypothetical protein U0004_29480 [Janthinobacterium lividum]STS86029.1 Uncharacterised protein [Janthinobacterium lividum]
MAIREFFVEMFELQQSMEDMRSNYSRSWARDGTFENGLAQNFGLAGLLHADGAPCEEAEMPFCL